MYWLATLSEQMSGDRFLAGHVYSGDVKRFVAAGLLIAVLLVGLPMVGSGDAGTTDAHEAGVESGEILDAADSAVLQNNETDEEVNETERHQNPDEYDGEGDDEAVAAWLSGWLSGQLGESTVQISEGEYELARDILGDEYDERLEQFVEVTGAGDDEEETLRETRDKQEELIDLREEFEETLAAYEQALEDGDAERARELARQLVALAEEIEDVTADLDELLAEIEDIIDQDLSEVREMIGEIRTETVTDADAIAEEEFINTELTVEPVATDVSFLDPAVLEGQLQTLDGEALANESVQMTVEGESFTVETGPDGEFTLEYRPTDVPLSQDTLSVAYVPAPDSIYLGNETTVSVTVTQVEPTLDASATPETVRFGDQITVSGELAVEDVPVDGVPVTIALGGEELGTATVIDGSFDAAVDVPASVPLGEQELTVELPFENQALAGVSERVTVTVEETETSLSVTASQNDGASLDVSGTLTTVNGIGVGGQSIMLSLNGERVDTVTTDADGSFSESIALPADSDGEEVEVVASFDGTDSNLGSSQDDTLVTVDLPAGTGDGTSSGEGSPLTEPVVDGAPIVGTLSLLGILLGTGGLLLLLAGAWWYRERNRDAPTVGDETSISEEPTTESGPSVVESLFDHASDHLEAGQPDSAVQACYSAVRRQFASTVETGQALTHWEFHRAYLDSGAGQGEGEADLTEDALRDVTETYERAVYSPATVSIDEASRAVEHARKLCTRSDGGTVEGDGRERE